MTSSKENKGRRGREMGRPKLENPLTNAERKKWWRQKNKENKDETEKEKDRQRKAEKRSKLTYKEKEDQRERNKEYKRKSHANRSYQKVLGTRLKDQNCKQRDKDTPKKKQKTSDSHKDYSTPRVQQYRERKKSQNSPFQIKLNSENCHWEIFQLQLATKLEKSLTTLIGWNHCQRKQLQ